MVKAFPYEVPSEWSELPQLKVRPGLPRLGIPACAWAGLRGRRVVGALICSSLSVFE